MSSVNEEIVTPNASGFEIAAPEDGNYSGAFLMDGIRRAKLTLAVQGGQRYVARHADDLLDPRLYDPESQQARYRELSDMPIELFEALAKETAEDMLAVALEAEHNARLDRIVHGLQDIVKEHYMDRQLRVNRLPGIQFQPISLHGTSYTPKTRQSVKGDISPWNLPERLIIATRWSRYNVQTHSRRRDFKPLVDITMLD